MNNQQIFFQAYWWLSLLGGIHCIGVAFYIRYIYHSHNNSHKALAMIFALIGFYFFTGLITRETTPIPIHLMLTLIIPVYFILMPLLYIYSKQSLYGNHYHPSYAKHFSITLMAALMTSSAMLFRVGINPKISDNAIQSLADLSQINMLAIILPLLLVAQTIIYFVLIYQLLSKFRKQLVSNNGLCLSDIRFRWICLLVIGILVNWIIRLSLVYLPFVIGDSLSLLAQATTRLSMLVTVYVFAFYGLHQITRAAYLRGVSGQAVPITHGNLSSQQILDDTEKAFIQDVIHNNPDTHINK
ncbi:hypothetical protein [Shewanella aestuarii]|uniref:Uncharacterized protein n=1 Tax=Shewanella aestuarii TaxID=1028752 RepID=A0A6G9QMK4_9GAMM|nr:hypothetical protein [Shewanella aestuarii]QIR15814.1 hypothetical protein HBH39_16060 [Shewanella aestuarii]